MANTTWKCIKCHDVQQTTGGNQPNIANCTSDPNGYGHDWQGNAVIIWECTRCGAGYTSANNANNPNNASGANSTNDLTIFPYDSVVSVSALQSLVLELPQLEPVLEQAAQSFQDQLTKAPPRPCPGGSAIVMDSNGNLTPALPGNHNWVVNSIVYPHPIEPLQDTILL